MGYEKFLVFTTCRGSRKSESREASVGGCGHEWLPGSGARAQTRIPSAEDSCAS
jgi:hypothetical protein